MSTDEQKNSKPIGTKEIQLYSLNTPNGVKVALFLEEADIPYDFHKIPISGSEALQFTPWFTELNPNNKIPVITDLNGPNGKPFTLFESGAILLYLAEKYGKFLPTDAAGKAIATQWLMFQMSAVGPMTGQMVHFWHYAQENIPYGKNRYKNEVFRLYHVLEKRLAVSPYLAGDEYTIADIATWPWINLPLFVKFGGDISVFPHLRAWVQKIEARPAVKRVPRQLPGSSIAVKKE